MFAKLKMKLKDATSHEFEIYYSKGNKTVDDTSTLDLRNAFNNFSNVKKNVEQLGESISKVVQV